MFTRVSLAGIFLCALSLVGFAHANVKPTADDKVGDSNFMKSDLTIDPQIVQGSLSNGLRYLIRPNSEPKGRVSLRMYVNVGSLSEAEDERGLSHFLEHMVFGGSKSYKDGELVPALQRQGLTFGRDVNAYTAFEETVYMLDLPNLKPDTLKFSMTVLREFADGATFAKGALDRERGVIYNELKTRDSADYRILKETLKFVLEGTNFVERMPIGIEKVILETPQEKFLEYHGKHYAADQIVFVLVGDMPVKEAEGLIKEYFSTLKPSGLNNVANRGVLKEKTVRQAKIMHEPEIPMTKLSLTNAKYYEPEADTIASRVKYLPIQLAIMMLNKRFEILKKQADCPFISLGAYADNMLNASRIVAVDAQCAPAKWALTLNVMEQELRRARQHGFSDLEFEEARRKFEQQLDRAVEVWGTTPSDDIADFIVSSLGEKKVVVAPEEQRRIFLDALKKMTVKNCDVALREETSPDATMVVATGTVNVPQGEKELLLAYETSSKIPVAAPDAKDKQVFAYGEVGKQGKIAVQHKVEDLGIMQLTLSNGVKVNYKKTDFEKNTIDLEARVDGGSLTLPENKTGLDMYASTVFNEGGLKAHSNDDLEQIFAGHQVGVRVGVDEDAFVFSGRTTMKDLALELQLLCAHLMHPGYREEADVTFKRAIPLLFEKQERDSAGIYQMNVMNILMANDYRFSFPKKEQLLSYTVKDVQDWVGDKLEKNALELNIVGDFDEKELISLLERTIGALPARTLERVKPLDKQVLTKAAPMGGNHVLTYPTKLDKSMTSVVWKSPDGLDKTRNIRLRILESIVGNRIREEIREKMGDAYSPGGRFRMSDFYKDFGFYIAQSPGTSENSDRVAKALQEMGETFTKDSIAPDELDRIRRPLLANWEKAQRQNSYWMNAGLRDSQHDKEKLDRLREYKNILESTTVAEINALAKQIFAPSNSTIIRVVPASAENPSSEGEKDASLPASGDSSSFGSAAQLIVPAEGEYAVVLSEATAKNPEWKLVSDSLAAKYKGKVFF